MLFRSVAAGGVHAPGVALGLNVLEHAIELGWERGIDHDLRAAHVDDVIDVLDVHRALLHARSTGGAGPQGLGVDDVTDERLRGLGLDVGAQYAALRGSNRNEPGVMLVIRSWGEDPVRVVQGETLSRRPVVGADIVAAVVTDGEDAFVLQGPALAALAASSAEWKKDRKSTRLNSSH